MTEVRNIGGHMPAMHVDDGLRGGWMNPTDNPKVAGAVILVPLSQSRPRTVSERNAFRKRVAKRRKRKGYA